MPLIFLSFVFCFRFRKYFFFFIFLFNSSSVFSDEKLEFNRDVRSILSDNCFECHGPDAANRKAGLRLDTEGFISKIVNPNNPDGRVVEKKEILELASYANEIIIDESFADLRPEISMVPCINDKDITVFKSVGKFFGLPGMRLGFVIAKYSKIRTLKKFTGPWNISGPALEVGLRALSDQDWVNKTRLRLKEGSKRLTKLLSSSGKLKVIGSTGLFILVETRDAKNAQVHFADRKIWTRVFDYSDKWIRLGIPGDEKSWSKLEYALAQFT